MLFYSKVLLMMMITVTYGFQFDSKVFTKMEKKKVVNLEHILHHLESSAIEETIHKDKIPNNGCVCVNDNCGCCTHIDSKPLHIHDTICANVSYLPAEIGVALTVTFGKLTIINQTVSGCIAVGIRFIKVIHENYKLGCFTIPLRKEIGSAQLKKPEDVFNITVPRMGREPNARLHSSKDLQGIKHTEMNGSK